MRYLNEAGSRRRGRGIATTVTRDIPHYSACPGKANQQLGKTVTISEAVAEAAAPLRKTDTGTNHTEAEERPRSASLLPGIGPVTDGEAPLASGFSGGKPRTQCPFSFPRVMGVFLGGSLGSHLTRITGEWTKLKH